MKAQVSMEFMYFVAIILTILTVISYVTITSSKDLSSENEVRDAMAIAALMAQEINTAISVGSGYQHTFVIPHLFSSGVNYSVTFPESRYVYINWANKTYSLPVIADNISGVVNKGDVIIRNVDGVIYVD